MEKIMMQFESAVKAFVNAKTEATANTVVAVMGEIIANELEFIEAQKNFKKLTVKKEKLVTNKPVIPENGTSKDFEKFVKDLKKYEGKLEEIENEINLLVSENPRLVTPIEEAVEVKEEVITKVTEENSFVKAEPTTSHNIEKKKIASFISFIEERETENGTTFFGLVDEFGILSDTRIRLTEGVKSLIRRDTDANEKFLYYIDNAFENEDGSIFIKHVSRCE